MMLAGWLFAGGGIGLLNGLSMWWTVAHLHPASPRAALVQVLGGALLRWALVAALLTLGLRQGIAPGLLAFAGQWLARWGLVCWLNGTPRLE